MTAKAALPKTDSKDLPDDKRNAQKAFFVALFDLTWRMAGAMLLPIFIGLYIDSRVAGDGKTYAIIGFFVGILAGVIIIRQIIKKATPNA